MRAVNGISELASYGDGMAFSRCHLRWPAT
jgi:hypothetical protein